MNGLKTIQEDWSIRTKTIKEDVLSIEAFIETLTESIDEYHMGDGISESISNAGTDVKEQYQKLETYRRMIEGYDIDILDCADEANVKIKKATDRAVIQLDSKKLNMRRRTNRLVER